MNIKISKFISIGLFYDQDELERLTETTKLFDQKVCSFFDGKYTYLSLDRLSIGPAPRGGNAPSGDSVSFDQ